MPEVGHGIFCDYGRLADAWSARLVTARLAVSIGTVPEYAPSARPVVGWTPEALRIRSELRAAAHAVAALMLVRPVASVTPLADARARAYARAFAGNSTGG